MKKMVLAFVLLFTHSLAATLVDAEKYNANSSLQLDWATAVMQRIELRGDERILDVGSGNGKMTARLADQVPTGFVVGLDLSSTMVEYASDHYKRKNLLFIKEDLCMDPFMEQFDLVTSFCSLIWIQDQRKALESVHHSLVPGGFFVAVQPASQPSNLSPAALRVASRPDWVPFFPNFQPQRFYLTYEECLSLLKEVGFEQMFVKEINAQEHFSSMEAFLDWLRPLTGFAKDLPDYLQEKFLLEIANEMVEVKRDGVWLSDIKLEVIARRSSCEKNTEY